MTIATGLFSFSSFQPLASPNVSQFRIGVASGTGDFTDSGQSLGNHNSHGVSLGDVDGDGDLDAFITNTGSGNRVWLNNGAGMFIDSGQRLGVEVARAPPVPCRWLIAIASDRFHQS